MDVRLKAKKGDFSVYFSKLIITHEDCGDPVPEPTTLALVGAGVAAMARRRWLT
ncbi:MAG: PEP-CTERM sorting domain-containing protein [Candidatus Omnitrophica bacterium]|nr:PEP-CTERM sorting domain-containing protein [Candidatus Omnitrophota bacterium]